MAAITWDQVLLLASDLDAVSDDAQDLILSWVNDALNPATFGGESAPMLILARVYLAAHFACGGGVAGAPGDGGLGGGQVVTGESGGGLSETYAAPMFSLGMTTDMLKLTDYGRKYLALAPPLARAWVAL